MSTNARVGILNEDGTITSIYTHWDGYPSHHAPILRENYGNEDKVRALMELGDLSELDEEIGEKHPFEKHSEYPGWCCSYRRDREEEDTDAITHPANEWPDYGQSHTYLFDPASSTWAIGP